jgi:putative membrane protein
MADAANKAYKVASWSAIWTWVVCTALGIFRPLNPIVHLQWYLLTVSLTIFALFHGARRHGWFSTWSLFVIAAVISNVSEHLSITTGFPFGFYVHTDQMGPKIFLVPIIIGPIYFGICYIAWTLTEMILHETAQSRRATFIVGAPIVAALIVTGFDLCFDPIGATLGRFWIYRGGGGYFGTPLANYRGWFINAWGIFQCFAILLAWRPSNTRLFAAGYWLEVSVFWGLMGLQYPILLCATSSAAVVHDPGGWAWRTEDILQNAAIISVYTMLLASVVSVLVIKLAGPPSNTTCVREPRSREALA